MSTQKEDSATALPKSNLEHRRVESYSEQYANNIRFETSLWDQKMIFGQLEQSLGPNVILQHTGMTIPWPQVKLAIYFLSVNLISHEGQAGRVKIPAGLVPEIPKQMPKQIKDEGATSEETWQAIRKLYEDFVVANPEAAPKKGEG